MQRLAPTLVLCGLALATWKPVVRIGLPTPLGRLDAWAVHGMSHGRVDGIDPLQVALTLVTVGLAVSDLTQGRARTPLAVVALLGVLAFRVLRHLGYGMTMDYGVGGVGLLAASLVAYWLSSRR